MLAALAAGGLWAGAAAWLRVQLGVNEILTTLMANFIAVFLMQWLVHGPWRSREGFPYSDTVAESLWLPYLAPPLHIGIILALVLSPLLYFLLFYTTLGYQIRAVGADALAARFAGMRLGRTVLVAVLISGAAAGLAGAVEVLGVRHSLRDEITGPNYGYVAIAVALLARSSPLWVPLSALFFGTLLAASVSLHVVLADGTENLIIGVLIMVLLLLERGIERARQ
ncbi:MAG: ABC transporter permease, partial [Deinococcus sp.]|nr:ABC transporter permease [Deinococcus sp.]